MTGGICRRTAPKLDTQIVRHATAAGALTAPNSHHQTGNTMPIIDLIALIIVLTIMSTGFLLYIESL